MSFYSIDTLKSVVDDGSKIVFTDGSHDIIINRRPNNVIFYGGAIQSWQSLQEYLYNSSGFLTNSSGLPLVNLSHPIGHGGHRLPSEGKKLGAPFKAIRKIIKSITLTPDEVTVIEARAKKNKTSFSNEVGSLVRGLIDGK